MEEQLGIVSDESLETMLWSEVVSRLVQCQKARDMGGFQTVRVQSRFLFEAYHSDSQWMNDFSLLSDRRRLVSALCKRSLPHWKSPISSCDRRFCTLLCKLSQEVRLPDRLPGQDNFIIGLTDHDA